MSNYHGRIMNIIEDGVSTPYKLGHRDARHAAAEIATEADIKLARLTAENEALRAVLAEDRALFKLVWIGGAFARQDGLLEAMERIDAALSARQGEGET